MTNNLYTSIAAIKNKFDKLITFIIKEQSVECATAKVIDLFSDAVKVENHINQAYYQEDSTTFYLPNSNGICISVFSGKGDIFGSSHTHRGTDLTIIFAFDGSYYTLYDEDKFQNHEARRLQHKLNDHPEYYDEKGVRDMLSAKHGFDPYVYSTLPKIIQEDPKVIQIVLDQLWRMAESEHDDEKNYEHISPAGGFDIDVRDPEEHFERYLSFINTNILKTASEKYLKKINKARLEIS